MNHFWGFLSSLLTEQLGAESKLVFEDVSEEFSELEAILTHFEEWRERDMNSYKDSYFSLCLPKVSISCIVYFSLIWLGSFRVDRGCSRV